MSTRKGIGLGYLKEHLNEIIANDGILLPNGTKRPLPRYFNKKIAELIGTERYQEELAKPRADRAKAYMEEEMARTGLSIDELYQRQVEQAKQNIQNKRRRNNDSI